MTTLCGLTGSLGSLSMITFLGGGTRLPEIVMRLVSMFLGGLGGISRMTRGSGVGMRSGSWRMMIGGAVVVT